MAVASDAVISEYDGHGYGAVGYNGLVNGYPSDYGYGPAIQPNLVPVVSKVAYGPGYGAYGAYGGYGGYGAYGSGYGNGYGNEYGHGYGHHDDGHDTYVSNTFTFL